MFTRPARVNRVLRLIVLLLLVGMGLSNSPAMAGSVGQYIGSSYGQINLNPVYSNYTFAVQQPGYNPGINQRPTGTATGNASFSNNDAQGIVGSTGVWASSSSSGFASLNPAGSMAISSDSNLSQFTLGYSHTGIVAFDVSLALQTSVIVDSPDEIGVDYADIKVYVDATEVFSTSSVASSFGTGLSQTTGLSETTALMAFYVPPGLTTIEVVTYTNGEVYTVAAPPPPPPPPGVPEPSSLVLGLVGASLIGLCLLRRRVQDNRFRS
jgi:hypothetical protein